MQLERYPKMSKLHNMQMECSRHLSAMIQLMNGKVGYDENDIIFLITNWVRTVASYPYPSGDPKEYGKNYPKLFKSYLMSQRVRKDAQLIATRKEEDPDAGDKSSTFVYRKLLHLANQIYVDTGFGFFNVRLTQSALLEMIYNYRVLLARQDAVLSRKFDARLRSLILV